MSSTVAIFGSEPEIYFYAHRHSATGYIYTYPLMEHQAFAEKMQQEMIAEIERARPEFIVMVNVPFSWLARPDSPRTIFDWAQKYVPENHKVDGLVDILEDSQYRGGRPGHLPTSISIHCSSVQKVSPGHSRELRARNLPVR